MTLTLNKQTVNLDIDQGCTFEKVITTKDTAGSNVSISSGTTAAKLRQSFHSSNNIHSFSTSVSGSNVTISMAATNTTDIFAGQYVYDVEYTQSGGTAVEIIAEGVVTVSPEATRDHVYIDGLWGSTRWTDFLRNDGNRDRMVTWKGSGTNLEWGDSGEDRWYEMEGPHHQDIV